ncbi:hypothetical protein [Microbispora sp. NPDC049125]|uniref:hypothetical protein n=1 Tax=Microbispora sp. NPDC049125 TaxID=3154929 RepID=UPI003467695C
MQVIRDPAHPDFPHGTRIGRIRGCDGECPKTPSCSAAYLRSRRRTEYRRAGIPVPPEPHTLVPTERAARHIEHVREVTGATYRLLAEACGVDESTLRRITSGRFSSIAFSISQQITAMNVLEVNQRVRDRSKHVKITAKHIQLIRSMQAQNWSLRWQAEQIGVGSEWIGKIARGQARYAAPEVIARIHSLAREVIGRYGPDDRVGAAARKTWHPLAHYDEDGNLDLEGIAGEEELEAVSKAAGRSKAARNRLLTLHLTICFRMSCPEIAKELGIRSDQAQRWRAEVGLSFEQAFDGRYVLDEDGRRRAKEILPLIRKYVEHPLTDPRPVGTELTKLVKKLDKAAKKAAEEAARRAESDPTAESEQQAA